MKRYCLFTFISLHRRLSSDTATLSELEIATIQEHPDLNITVAQLIWRSPNRTVRYLEAHSGETARMSSGLSEV